MGGVQLLSDSVKAVNYDFFLYEAITQQLKKLVGPNSNTCIEHGTLILYCEYILSYSVFHNTSKFPLST